ncbi:four helix bundle protein [Patescibacteria group bacterium]
MTEKVFDIRKRSFEFGASIIRLSTKLPKNSAGYAVCNQIVRSGTSVGANIEEAQSAGTKKEFIRGITIALKEARETKYWLRLIAETKLAQTKEIERLIEENTEIIKILITIIKKSKAKP